MMMMIVQALVRCTSKQLNWSHRQMPGGSTGGCGVSM